MNKIHFVSFIFLFFLLLSFSSVIASTLNNDIVEYYKFDENTGSITVNSVSSVNANITNPVWNSSKIFNSLSYSSGVIVSKPVVTLSGDWSVSAWIYPTSVSGFRSIIYNRPSTTGFGLFQNDAKIQARWWTGTGNNINIANTGDVLSINTWHHVVAVYVGGVFQIYINGVNYAGSTTATTSGVTGSFIGYNSADTVSFSGLIDELGVWNRNLSSSEINYLYNLQDSNNNICAQYNIFECTIGNFSVTVTDEWSGVAVNNITLTLANSTSYSNTTGNIIYTNIPSNSSSLFNYNISSPSYFAKSFTGVNVSSNANNNLAQSYVTFVAKDINNVTLPFVNVTASVSGILNDVSYNLLVNSSAYFLFESTPEFCTICITSNISLLVPSSCINTDGNLTIRMNGTSNKNNIYCTNTPTGFDQLIYRDVNSLLNSNGVFSFQNINTTIGSSQQVMFPLSSNNYTVTASFPSYFNLIDTISVTPLLNTTFEIVGFHDHIVFLSIKEIVTNVSIMNFSGVVSNGFTTKPFITTNGTASLTFFKNSNATITLNTISGFSTDNLTFSFISNNASTSNFTHFIFYNNSILFSIFNAKTNSLLLQNVNLTLFSNSITYNFNTSNGTSYNFPLLSGTYTVTAASSNFTSLQQIVTLNNGQNRIVKFYLTDGLLNTVLRVIDNKGVFVSNATITVTYVINGTSVTHSVSKTDLSGSVNIPLDKEQEYTITVTKSGYETFVGELIPFENEYFIYINTLGASISISPANSIFLNYNITYSNNTGIAYFDINSALGELSYWGMSFTDDVTNFFINQTNPNGGNLQQPFVINSSTTSTLTITYWYATINNEYQEYTITYQLLSATPSDTSLTKIRSTLLINNNFTKAMLGFFIILIFLIIANSITSNEIIIIISGLVGIGISTFLGFFSPIMAGVSVIVSIVIIISNMKDEVKN